MRSFALAVSVAVLTMPIAAHAQQNLNRDQLIQLAKDQKVCDVAEVLDAKYDPADNDRILVTCGRAAGQTAGLGGSAGLAVGGLLLVALAAGGGGSTPSTNGTN